MINTKKQLIHVLSIEKKYYNPSFFGQIAAIFGLSEKNMIWRYIKRLRKWEYHLNRNHFFRTKLYHFLTTRLGFKYGFHIAPNTVDEGLCITHIGSILINNLTKIGKNCTIHINTAFLAKNGLGPTIGDNCTFCVGSKIIGNISIPNSTIVGAGAIVTKTFLESGTTLGGIPAVVISRNGVV